MASFSLSDFSKGLKFDNNKLKQMEKKMTDITPDEIKIKGVTFVPKDSIKEKVVNLSSIVLVRTYSAGVHFGTIKEHDRVTNHLVLVNAKRLWKWSGACSLSQVAMDGVDLNDTNISVSVPEITLGNVIEIIPLSEKTAKQLMEAKEWKK